MSYIEISQLVTAIATLAVVIVVAWQTKVNSKQLKAQYLNHIFTYLQEPNVREARSYVSTVLKHKEFSEWSDHDKEQASIVCGAYGTAGVYLEKKLIELSDIDSYKVNVEDCYNSCVDFIDSRREGTRVYWRHFKYLFDSYFPEQKR